MTTSPSMTGRPQQPRGSSQLSRPRSRAGARPLGLMGKALRLSASLPPDFKADAGKLALGALRKN